MKEAERLAKAVGAFGGPEATALEVEEAIETELFSGDVTVTRSTSPGDTPFFYGHTWNVTFAGAEAMDVMPAMAVDGDKLVGDGTKVEAVLARPMAPRMRGSAHLFTREADGTFAEQALLSPFVTQRRDVYGVAAALSGDIGVVGAPNTDTVASGTNAGAVAPRGRRRN